MIGTTCNIAVIVLLRSGACCRESAHPRLGSAPEAYVVVSVGAFTIQGQAFSY